MWMPAGQIVGVHGIAGEVKVRPDCDSAEFLLPFRRFALQRRGSDQPEPVTAEGSRVHKGFLLLKLRGTDDRDAAQALRLAPLFFDRADAVLPEGKYFLSDLIGISVFTGDGTPLGVVAEVYQPPAHDVYRVTDGRTEHLIPAVPEFILSLNPEEKRMVVRLIEGM